MKPLNDIDPMELTEYAHDLPYPLQGKIVANEPMSTIGGNRYRYQLETTSGERYWFYYGDLRVVRTI